MIPQYEYSGIMDTGSKNPSRENQEEDSGTDIQSSIVEVMRIPNDEPTALERRTNHDENSQFISYINGNIRATSQRLVPRQEDTDWMSTIFDKGGLSPTPLPETIQFVQQTTAVLTRPNKKRSARPLPDEKVAYSTRSNSPHQQLETHRRRQVVGAVSSSSSLLQQEQQLHNLQAAGGNELFLMESLFVLLYLRRSSFMIPVTIDQLHSADHPMLLTLASYPFRVVFSNEAHQNLLRGCSSKNAKTASEVIGRTLFECFESDEDIMNTPSLSFYPNFLKLILNGRPCYINTRDNDGHVTAKVCTIKAEEVFSKKGESEALQYYAIHFIVAT